MVNGTVLLTLPRSIASGSAPPFQQDWAPCANGRGQHGQRPSTRRAFIIRPKSLCSCSMRCSMRAFMALSNLRSGQDVRASGQGVWVNPKRAMGLAWLGVAWHDITKIHKAQYVSICYIYSVCVCMYIYICVFSAITKIK